MEQEKVIIFWNIPNLKYTCVVFFSEHEALKSAADSSGLRVGNDPPKPNILNIIL
jgi:hypothetical protein